MNDWNILDRLTSIDELLRRTNAHLEWLYQAVAALSAGVPPTEAPATIITIPLDPELLNNLLEAQRLGRGRYKTLTYQVSVLIPGGDERTIPFSIPEGWVCTRREPLKARFSYYSEDITLTGWVGDGLFTAENISCAEPLDLSFGDYYVKKEEDVIVLRCVNHTATDSLLTLYVRPSLMTEELYNTFYEPLMTRGYATFEELLSRLREVAGV